MTFKYAKDHGWKIRTGEKSVRVEYWTHYDAALKKSLDRAEVERIQREEPERMKDIRLVAYTANVFNVEQIVGDIPPQEKRQNQVKVEHLVNVRNIFLDNLGVALGEGGDRAFYSPRLDRIQMPYIKTFDGDYAYMCTLLHEAAHATGHPSRLNRSSFSNSLDTSEYAKEELRAEIASAFTAQILGLPLKETELGFEIENHKAYIQSWIKVLEEDPKELFAAIKDAEKIADYLQEQGQLLEIKKLITQQEGYEAEEELEEDLEL